MNSNIWSKRFWQHCLEFSESDARIKTNDFHIEGSSTEVEILLEILMEEIKAVVSEKLDFEKRDNFNNLGVFLEIVVDQPLDTWMKSNGFPINMSSRSVNFVIQTPMDEIRPLVVEKKQFDPRVASMVPRSIAFFGNLGLSKL